MTPAARMKAGVTALRTQWQALGGFGKVTLFGVFLSMVLAVALGFLIPKVVRADLTSSRASSISAVVGDLTSKGLLKSVELTDDEMTVLDEAVRFKLLGGDTIRVKIWDDQGVIIYSDATALVGQAFPATAHRSAALDGTPSHGIASLVATETEYEKELGPLMEYYVPVRSADGQVIAVFEVYESAAPLNATVAAIRRDLSLAIAMGLLVLGAFMFALTGANAQVINRRTRQVEGLLSRLARAQDEERNRIVGALHDDIGPPLYRIYYGLQGARAMLKPNDPLAPELGRIEDLASHVESTLRAELNLLHHGSPEHLSLDALLKELANKITNEHDIAVQLDVSEHSTLSVAQRTAVFQAANEALSNVRRHSGASQVAIRLSDGNGRLLLDIEDDGIGMAGDPGLGLTITRERLEAHGGSLTVTGRKGGGTLVRAWVPTQEALVG